jgi:O-antigen ligase
MPVIPSFASDGRSERQRPRPRAVAIVFLLFLAAVALTGGSSRADSLAQSIVRGASVVFLIAGVALRARPDWGGVGSALALLGGLALLIAVQLVPLPPSWWTALPGRTFYTEAAAAFGAPQPWRPLALVPDRALNALLALLPPAAALTGLAWLTRRERAELALPVAALALASAVLGIAQMTGGPETGLQPYATNARDAAAGFFANRNHEALLLALALPALALWATGTDSRGEQLDARRGWAAAVAGGLLVLVIPTTGSRTGLILAGLGLAVAGLLVLAPARRALARLPRRKRRTALGVGLGALALLLFAALALGQAASVQRFFLLSAGEDLRGRVLPAELEMLRSFFPAGIGFGGFDPIFRRFEPFELLRFTYLNQAHNDVLQILIEAGAAGGLLLAAAALWWGWHTVRLWRLPQTMPYVRLGRVASAMLVMVALASLTDYPLRTPLMMVVTAVLAGWLLAYRTRSPLPAGGRGDNQNFTAA